MSKYRFRLTLLEFLAICASSYVVSFILGSITTFIGLGYPYNLIAALTITFIAVYLIYRWLVKTRPDEE